MNDTLYPKPTKALADKRPELAPDAVLGISISISLHLVWWNRRDSMTPAGFES